MTSVHDRYLTERVVTATPAELTGLVFDAGVAAMRAAAAAQADGDWAFASAQLLRAQAMVLELRCALNPEAGQLATSLSALYTYVHSRLVHANVARDPAATAEALDLFAPLQQAWRESILCRAA